MEKINNVISIPVSSLNRFFKYWLEFIRPFHMLTDKEMDVVASFLKYRHELSKVIIDPEVLDKNIMSDDIKRKVREDCEISQAHFQVIMTKLRKSKILDNNKINPKFIPRLAENADSFQLLLSFDFKWITQE